MKNRVHYSSILLQLMRITLVQLLATLLLGGVTLARPVRAQELLDQKITLRAENERLRTVLGRIEKAAQVSFMYQSKVLADNPRLTLSVSGRPLGEVLNELFPPRQLRYEIIGRQIVLSRRPADLAEARIEPPLVLPDPPTPQARLTGTVRDEAGAPLPGVNVRVKDTTYGTTTTASGEYSLTVPDDVARTGTLVFSSVGYNPQEVAIGNRSGINVTLAVNIQSLGEVVVVGYGTQRQKEVTGAVASVGSKEINAVAVTGLDQALQGRMAGVQVTQNSGEPGGSVSVKIRGVGSISSGTEPLYVVDGIPLAGSLNAINPNDIERIDVLKDAASAAIYGSRGSNGVVLVTTKRGKAGKITVSLDAYAGVQSAAKKLNLLNGPQFARLANENATNAGLPTNPAWANPDAQPTYDWQDAVLQKSAIQNYNVSISGGSERSRTFFSAGFFQQGGIIVGSDYKRYTTRLNTDYDLGKRIKVGATLNVAYDVKNAVPTESNFSGVLVNAAQLQPTSPIFASQEGTINDHFYGWQGYNFISKTAPIGFYPSGLNNEVHTNKEYFKRPQTNLQLLGAVFGEVEIISGLKLRSTLNLTIGNAFSTYSQQRSPDEITSVGQYRNLAGYSENWSRSDQWNWINTLSYGRTIGRHTFAVIAGTDALRNNYRGVNISTVGNPDDQLSINASNPVGRVATGAPSDFSLVSYIGRATYDFAGKYLLTANFRRDGSSKFGPNYKYGNFPSASVGWRISEEPFMKSVPFVNELKLRASYGVVGNQNIANFLYLNTYSSDAGQYQYVLNGNTPVSALYANNIGDPNIRWEKSIQSNVGVDASFMQGKFTLTADYYIKDLKDLLGYVPIPTYTGVYGGYVFRNGFSMQNKGFELALGYNQQIGQVRFSANANFSTLANKVTQLDGSDKSYVARSISVGDGRDDNAQTRSQVGERIANFWGYVSDGIFQNQGEVDNGGMGGVKPGDRRFKDLNGDGKINASDKTILGNGLPKYIFGLNLSAQYKGFDLTVFLNGQADVQIANMTRFFLYNMRYYNSTGVTNGSVDLLDSWHGPGTSNTMPRNSYDVPQSNRYFSTYYIENGAFLRLRNLQLGYSLPETFAKRLGMGRARIYVAAQNLLTFTKYSGYDPEVGSINQNVLTTGTDYGRYPVARIIMGGINFQF